MDLLLSKTKGSRLCKLCLDLDSLNGFAFAPLENIRIFGFLFCYVFKSNKLIKN